MKYTVADRTSSRFISTARPYGFRRFGQAGAQVRCITTRASPQTLAAIAVGRLQGSVTPPLWGKLELTGSVFPQRGTLRRVREHRGCRYGIPTFPC